MKGRLKYFSAVFFLLASTSLLIFLTSCSVKEDRRLCPATLLLDLPAADSAASSLHIRTLAPDNKASITHVALGERRIRHKIPVARGKFIIVVSSVALQDGRWLVPEGSPCPEAYICRRRITVSKEQALFEVRLQKEFCRLDIKLSAPAEGFSMRIRGRYCGSSLEGNLIEGVFSAPVGSGGSVCVPRQGDASLMLDVVMPSEGIVRSFALGEYLREAGYNWQEGDLQDASVYVDYVRSEAVISTACWTRTISLKYLL